MLQEFFTVGEQVAILFLLIGIGALCAKTRLLDEKAVKAMANLVLYVATPAVIIKSCIREFDPNLLWGFLTVVAVAAVNHGLLILAAHLFFRGKEENRRRVFRCALVFSNAGYMAIPLQQAILGDTGVFYCAAYVIVFNVFLWTYGLMEMSGQRKLSAKQILFNPGVLGVAVGLVLFLLPISVPTMLTDAVNHLAVLNTPLPMLIIGYYLAQTNLLKALRDRASWLCMVLRLVGIPLLALGLLLLCGVRGDLLTACMICISTPVATSNAMFSARHERDTGLAVNLVSVSTLLSVVTLPVMVALADYLDALIWSVTV